MIKRFTYVLLLISLILQGCTALLDGHLVAVESYAPVQNVSGSYYLTSTPGQSGYEKQPFENALQNMLASKGYIRTFTQDKADYTIVYDYSVTGPFTTEEMYPAAVSSWIGAEKTYSNGVQESVAYSTDTQYENYFVKKLNLSANSKTNNLVWKVVGSVQSETMNQNIGYEYLISGISNYIDTTSGKVIHINVVKDSKTGEYKATKI